MTIQELQKIFRQEISGLYSTSESEVLFYIFCQKILNKNRIEVKLYLSDIINDSLKNKFLEKLSELKNGKPYQQIFSEAEFFGMNFFVDENVLIPRPETEELLELAIDKIKNSVILNAAQRSEESHPVDSSLHSAPLHSVQNDKTLKILDIGTGSGVIPIVLKKHFPAALITSVDFSENALKIARKNADFHQTEINFILADYLDWNPVEKYDVIISNPPYIGIDEEVEIENIVKGFEPKMALFSSTSDALIFYRKIANDAENCLNENGMIFLEINQKLGKETLELLQNFSEAELLKDISGNDRMIFVKK